MGRGGFRHSWLSPGVRSLPRIIEAGKRRDAALLGLGLGLQILTSKPYESLFLTAGVLIFLIPAARYRMQPERLVALTPIALVALTPALVLILFQNRSVTGSFTTMPYLASRVQYGIPTTFTVQPLPIPPPAYAGQQSDYDAQSAVHGPGT